MATFILLMAGAAYMQMKQDAQTLVILAIIVAGIAYLNVAFSKAYVIVFMLLFMYLGLKV